MQIYNTILHEEEQIIPTTDTLFFGLAALLLYRLFTYETSWSPPRVVRHLAMNFLRNQQPIVLYSRSTTLSSSKTPKKSKHKAWDFS